MSIFCTFRRCLTSNSPSNEYHQSEQHIHVWGHLDENLLVYDIRNLGKDKFPPINRRGQYRHYSQPDKWLLHAELLGSHMGGYVNKGNESHVVSAEAPDSFLGILWSKLKRVANIGH